MRVIAAVATLLVPSLVAGQADCFPASESNEAKTFAILSVPLAFAHAGTPSASGFGVGFEGAWVPDVPRTIATPTTCRPGKGPENTNPLDAVGRLRLSYTTGMWLIEVGWIPPIRISGIRANLVGVGVGRVVAIGGKWRIVPRVHALLGSLEAPITCNTEALDEVESECFGGQLSNDRWTPGILGADVTVAWDGGGLRPFLGLGHSWLRPRFQVDFTNAVGDRDRRRVEVDLTRMALFAGVTLRAGAFDITGEGYGTIDDRVTARVVVRTGVGR